MANTVSILSLANTFGDWVVTTNALSKENNDFAANNFKKPTGTLFLEDNDLGLHVANNAVIGGGLQVYGTGSSAYIEQNLRVDKQVYFTNTSLGLTNSGQANIGGPLYALSSANGVIASNDITVGGHTYVTGNVYGTSSLVIGGSSLLNGTLNVLGASTIDDTLFVTDNVTIVKATTTKELHANTYVITPTIYVTSFLDAGQGASQLHIVTANNLTSGQGYINVLQSNTKINAETTNTTTLNATISNAGRSYVTGLFSAINGAVSNFDVSTTNTATIQTLSANNSVIHTLNSDVLINAETITVSTLQPTVLSTPKANVSTLLDANSATAFIGTLQTVGKLTVGGDFVINGSTVYNSNTLTLSAQSGNQISSLQVYRSGADANAAIRWYEPSSYWDVKDVGSGTYSRIMLYSNMSDSIACTSTTQVATSRVANTLNDTFVTANTFLQNAVRSTGSYANAAFSMANNAMIAGGQVAGSYANSAYSQANAAYARANTSANVFLGTTGSVQHSGGIISFSGNNGMTIVATTANNLAIGTPQDLRLSASPTFNALTLSTALPISSGGTGATSAGAALTNLLPGGATAGYVLTTGGSGSYYWAAGGSGGGGGGATPGTTVSSSRTTVTATGGQTRFFAPSPFTVGASQTRIFVNGVRQYPGDYSEYSLALSGVSIASSGGAFTCTSTSGLTVGRAVTVVGSLTGSGTITNYFGTKTYYIIATNGTTTFTLSESVGGSAIETTTGSTTGLTFTTNYAVDLNVGVVANDSVLVEVDGYYLNPYYANNIGFTINSTISSSANTIQLAIDTLASKVAYTSGADFTGISRVLNPNANVSNTQIASTQFVKDVLNQTTSTSGVTYAISTSGNAGSASKLNYKLTAGSGLNGNAFDGTAPATWALTTTGVTADTYGSSSAIPVITVDSYGRITGVSTSSVSTTISLGAGSGSGSITGGGTLTLSGGTGISTSVATGTFTITNTGVTNVSGGTGVSVSSSTGSVTISIGQAVGTTSSVTFASETISGSSQINSLGVGTPASGTAGQIRATNSVTSYYSDARLKNFEGTIDDALNKVLSLNGYYFTENQKAKELGYNNDSRQVGVSAQEVEAVLPEVISEAPINANFEGADYKTVQYEKIVPLLIEAIKEQQKQIEELKGRIK